MDIDFNKLRFFFAVADHGSFSKAAQRLSVERSTISRAVASLESQLGSALFSRTTRRVVLTDRGQRFYEEIGPRYHSMTDAIEGFYHERDKPMGQLKVTAPQDMASIILPPILAVFTRRYPDITISVRATNQTLDLVADGIDIALRAGPLQDSNLIVRVLKKSRANVFASPDYIARAGHPLSFEALADHPWIVGPRGSWGFAGKNRPIQANDLGFVLQCVRLGLGVAVLPEFMVAQDLAEGRVVRLFENGAKLLGPIYLVRQNLKRVPPHIRVFWDYLLQHCSDD